MKTALLILLITLFTRTLSQTEPDEPDADPPGEIVSGYAPARSSTEDSLYRMLARNEISRATEHVASTGLIQRLIPRMQIGATYGVRELVFPESAGALLLPKDSYRLTLSLSLSEILNGSQHALAQLELEKARIRYALLLEKQARAWRAAERKKIALEGELERLRQELQINSLLARYQEYQFQQGKTESPGLARVRLEEIRIKSRIRQLEYLLSR